MWRSKFFLGIICLSCLALLSCRSPRSRVAERMAHLQADWQTNVVHQAHLPERAVDWNSALEVMRAANPRLRQLRHEQTNAQENVRQIFRDLTPTLNFRSGLSRSMRNIAATSFDDVTFSIDSFFNLPGLVSFGARFYIARLLELRANTLYALGEREQAIELYRLFFAAQDAQEQAAYLAAQREVAGAFREVDPFTGQMMMTQLDIRELTAERELQGLQQRAGELFGDRSRRWVFLTNGLPELRYEVEPLPVHDTNRVGRLQLQMAAIELEAARAQLAGIKLRYWPEFTMFVTAPPIYQRFFGQERFWDIRDLRVSGDLYWHIDTRGQIARQVRQVSRAQTLQRERLRQETLSLIDRLLATQALLAASAEQSRRLDAQLEVLRRFPPAQNFFALQKYSEDLRMLADQQRGLRRELVELRTLFWFVDEFAWAGSSAANPLEPDHPEGGAAPSLN